MNTTFEYGVASVADLQIQLREGPATARPMVQGIEVDGQVCTPTQRFWTSFFVRFGLSENVFRYFDHAEVFTRISAKAKSDRLRYCIEHDEEGNHTLLAVSNPTRPVIDYSEVLKLTERYGASETRYADGVVTSTHVPRSGNRTFEIAGDHFQHRFVMDTPIDGYSQPKIHLSFLRLLCANGAIGYSRAFRSEISTGNNIAYGITRALESYDNDEGYSVLRQRFSSAQQSWASLYECETLYRLLGKLQSNGHFPELPPGAVLAQFRQVTGSLHEFYGLANLDALSVKRQRVLPAKCRVYDLINFASELATHHAAADGHRALQAYIGNLISDEFDMEGTADKVSEFKDFFLAESTDGVPELN